MLIPLDHLILKYGIPQQGVIHIGAHQAEEAEVYQHCGFKKVVWIEGNTELLPAIEEKLKKFPAQKVYSAFIDVEEKTRTFHITNDPQSSSLFQLKEHATQYPSVTVEKEILCTTQRLDTFLNEHKLRAADYNFINLDIQGNELNALKSLGEQLKHLHYIYTEVQVTQLYEGSHTLSELDQFLFSKGFKRAETDLRYRSWGDALYVRSVSGNSISNTLKQLQSNWLVKSWPIRKKIYRFHDQILYFLNKLKKEKAA